MLRNHWRPRYFVSYRTEDSREAGEGALRQESASVSSYFMGTRFLSVSVLASGMRLRPLLWLRPRRRTRDGPRWSHPPGQTTSIRVLGSQCPCTQSHRRLAFSDRSREHLFNNPCVCKPGALPSVVTAAQRGPIWFQAYMPQH